MTTAANEPPRQGFRLSQLLYDTRYRSLTIQVVALALIAALIAYLARNAVVNLHALGKDIDFGFLSRRAGYDIGQTLIPYSNNDSHARASLVGILNTLLVAGLGCLLATVIGVLAGVLRLSKNWLLAKIAAVDQPISNMPFSAVIGASKRHCGTGSTSRWTAATPATATRGTTTTSCSCCAAWTGWSRVRGCSTCSGSSAIPKPSTTTNWPAPRWCWSPRPASRHTSVAVPRRRSGCCSRPPTTGASGPDRSIPATVTTWSSWPRRAT